jgi:hypothetical protein
MSQSLIPLKDTTNPRSVISLVSPKFQEAILNIPEEYFGIDATEYEKTIGAGDTLTQTDKRLRMAFWLEYDRAQARGIGMEMKRVLGGACSEDYFYRVLRNPKKVAYILIQPVSYELACKDLLDRSVMLLGQILDQITHSSKPDPKMYDVAIKIYNILDTRVNGAVVQRVEQKNLNVNVDAQKGPDSLSLDEVKKRLQELEKQNPEPRVIEVKAE